MILVHVVVYQILVFLCDHERERVFVAYFGGGGPAFFLFCTGPVTLLLFAGILYFFHDILCVCFIAT